MILRTNVLHIIYCIIYFSIKVLVNTTVHMVSGTDVPTMKKIANGSKMLLVHQCRYKQINLNRLIFAWYERRKMHLMTELLSYISSLPIQTVMILCACRCVTALISSIHNIIITKILLKNGKRHGRISQNDILF